MNGQLVGEVLDAIEDGRLTGLSGVDKWALIIIAEKCHSVTRQGSVRIDRIAAVTGAVRRTVQRSMVRLKERDLVRVVKRGYVSPKTGEGHANVYELLPIRANQAATQACDTQGDTCIDREHVTNTPKHVTNRPKRVTPMDVTHDGLSDGLSDGGAHAQAHDAAALRCPKHPDGNSEEPCRDCMRVRHHQEQQQRNASEERRRLGRERRTAIDGCGLCDEFGWLRDIEPLRRCTHSTIPTTGSKAG